ncbi:MAG TPA: metal-dependent transcriptional regulator [Acidimicrobiales bacterium]|nr:metal-dependent transcriptional regulator [Acidimicrobiales bacterium]
MVGDPGPSATSTTVDRYLESIYCIEGEGETVRPSRLAAWLGVSAPTVSVALQRLARDGWIDVAKDRSVTLTAAGQAAATAIVRRHRVLERWLVDVLAFDWATADGEADELAVAFSDVVVDRLDRSMGEPATCPHGNPIPGRAPTYGKLVALAALDHGVVAPIRRISEVAEHEARALLTTLADHGIEEGTEVEVRGATSDGETLRVRCGARTFELPRSAAQWIWVEGPGGG